MTFNVDIAEGIGNEYLLLPHVDLCNISCGAHAGSIEETRRAIILAQNHNVKIGAHPSYPDRENFGRVILDISIKDLKESITSQLSTFLSLCNEQEATLNHIKPHGALYHQIATNELVAGLFFDVINELSINFSIIGSPNSLFEKYCLKYNLDFIPEVFADRTYEDNGSLRKRTLPNATLSSQKEINEQVLLFKEEQKVKTITGKIISIKGKTICFHGDHTGCELILENCKTYISNQK